MVQIQIRSNIITKKNPDRFECLITKHLNNKLCITALQCKEKMIIYFLSNRLIGKKRINKYLELHWAKKHFPLRHLSILTSYLTSCAVLMYYLVYHDIV